jgi:Zinc finger, C3HC4 type (RING finger)
MKPNAWTGSAWGKGPAKASDEQDYEGDDACGICLNAPEAVSLQPCKHKICESCVDRLRYQLISTVGCPSFSNSMATLDAFTGPLGQLTACMLTECCRRRAV